MSENISITRQVQEATNTSERAGVVNGSDATDMADILHDLSQTNMLTGEETERLKNHLNNVTQKECS